MQIFNIGFLELAFILLLAFIVLGPQDMAKTGRQLAKFIRSIAKSELFKSVLDTSREIRDLPQKLVREAGAEEILEDIQKIQNARISDLDDLQNEILAPRQNSHEENSIHPESTDNHS